MELCSFKLMFRSSKDELCCFRIIKFFLQKTNVLSLKGLPICIFTLEVAKAKCFLVFVTLRCISIHSCKASANQGRVNERLKLCLRLLQQTILQEGIENLLLETDTFFNEQKCFSGVNLLQFCFSFLV
jgi:hypothetical protein